MFSKYARVFREPSGLPPRREMEHAINLVEGQGAVNVRFYRYPHYHKNEIEKQVKEILSIGIIRHSISSFSSLVILVKKKDNTWWMCIDYRALNKGKLTTTPILALHEFSKNFVIECNASGGGVGAILMQDKRPITYFSKALGTRNLVKSTYQKELMAVVLDIQHWRPYLLGRKFVVSADQKSLKQLLQQRVVNAVQQNWDVELLGLVIPNKFELIPTLLEEFHSSPHGGHSGFYKTYRRLAANVYWVGMKGTIQEFVKGCDICQRKKYMASSPGGLLQPWISYRLAQVKGEKEELLDQLEEHIEMYEPEGVLAARKVKQQGEEIKQILIYWKGKTLEEEKWEDEIMIKSQFPKFGFEDKATAEGGGIGKTQPTAGMPHEQLIHHESNGSKVWKNERSVVFP
ncbi:hypothetical protein KIW84_066204 [Lathyrus oleraceus]|uniref:Chromo domain-containing protein n=1 Tax=Pisum sativum TaxID=3888 RepID=A0A9D4WF53_PEA|nr:hypothetical protein KIW84_066204 [Pisum sativum]